MSSLTVWIALGLVLVLPVLALAVLWRVRNRGLLGDGTTVAAALASVLLPVAGPLVVVLGGVFLLMSRDLAATEQREELHLPPVESTDPDAGPAEDAPPSRRARRR